MFEHVRHRASVPHQQGGRPPAAPLHSRHPGAARPRDNATTGTPGTQRTHRARPAAVALRRGALHVRDGRPSPWRLHFAVAVALVLAVEVYLLYVTPPFVVGLWLASLIAVQTAVAAGRSRRAVEELARPPTTEQVACAVADALRASGLSPRGSEAVTMTVDERGQRGWVMVGVHAQTSTRFAAALDEVLAPVAAPGYAVRRWVVQGPVDLAQGLRAALGLLPPGGEVWHSVPAVLATSVERSDAFAQAWGHWVGGEATVHPVGSTPSAWRQLVRTR